MDSQHLVPELALIEELPEHWKSRFEKALYMLYESLEQSPALAWEEIAISCAISPHHFHRVFRAVFNEAPGQYLRRLRLQTVVEKLIYTSDSITDIAVGSGFSSSQALAKALKRELNTSAKAIRKLRERDSYDYLDELYNKLGHPTSQSHKTMESQIVEQLNTELRTYPERHLPSKRFSIPEFEKIMDEPGDEEFEVIVATDVEQLNNCFDDITVHVGEEFTSAFRANLAIAAGKYLCCKTNISTDVGYYAVWNELYRRAVLEGYELCEQGYTVEYLRNASTKLPYGMEIELQLPVEDVDG
ncbi:helix-turn-helix transcriptional regulator [Photobacterium alginatilyticum]|nr:helix-turn-helix transcriptional regulator [Photobacterium alginatilyticum]